MFQQFKDLVNKQVFKSESPKQGWDIDEDEPPIDESKEIIASIQQIQDMQMILEMEKQEFGEKHQQILQELEQERKVDQQYLEEEKLKLEFSRAEINKQQQFYEHAFKIKLDDGNTIDQLVNLNFKLTSDIQELEQFQQEQFQQYEDQIEIITKEKNNIQNKLSQLNHIIKQNLLKLKLDLKQINSCVCSQWLNQFMVQIQIKFSDLKQILHQKEIEIRDLTFANDDMQVKLLEADEMREDYNQLGKIVTELKKSENKLMIELDNLRANNQYMQSLAEQKNLENVCFELEEQIETIREEKIELKIELDNQKKLVKNLEDKLAEHSQIDNDELIDQIETKFEKKIYELYQQIDQKNNQIEELKSIHINELNGQLQHYQRIIKEYEGKLNLSIYKEHVQEEQLQQLQMCLVDSEFQANFNQQVLQEKIEKLEHEQHKEEEEKAIPEIADGGWQIEDENIDEPFEEEINNDFDDNSSKKQSGERKQESFEFRQGLVDNQWGIDFQDEPELNQQDAFKNFEEDEFEEGKQQHEELDKPIQKHQDPILEQKIDFIINNHHQELQIEKLENKQEWQNEDEFIDNQENEILEQDNKELVAEVNKYIEQQNKLQSDYQYIKDNQELQINVVKVKKNNSEWDLEDENSDQFGEESPIKQQQSDIYQNESESQIMIEVQKQLSDDFHLMLDSNTNQNIQSELNLGFCCNSNPKSMELNQEALKEDSIQGQVSQKLLDESILQEEKVIQDQNELQEHKNQSIKDVQQENDIVVSQYQEDMTIQRNQQLQDDNGQNEIVNYDDEQNLSNNQMLESEIILIVQYISYLPQIKKQPNIFKYQVCTSKDQIFTIFKI